MLKLHAFRKKLDAVVLWCSFTCVCMDYCRYVCLWQEIPHVLVQHCTVRELPGIQPRWRRILLLWQCV